MACLLEFNGLDRSSIAARVRARPRRARSVRASFPFKTTKAHNVPRGYNRSYGRQCLPWWRSVQRLCVPPHYQWALSSCTIDGGRSGSSPTCHGRILHRQGTGIFFSKQGHWWGLSWAQGQRAPMAPSLSYQPTVWYVILSQGTCLILHQCCPAVSSTARSCFKGPSHLAIRSVYAAAYIL